MKKAGPKAVREPDLMPLDDVQVHVVNRPGVVEEIIASGVSDACFIGAKANSKKEPYGTCLYRYTKNLIGWAVVETPDDDLGLEAVETGAVFALPPIPATIVEDLDCLFRLVDKKLGTECIALLTFDPKHLDTDNPGAGWGVLVPRQENSGASCHYDPTSVVDDKDDDVFIVGSAHSHPGMAAFASHTDVGDQADFEGIHITFGWSRNSPKTEYHIELQMGSGRFSLSPNIAFADYVVTDNESRYEPWIDKVKKHAPAAKTWTNGYTGSTNGSTFPKHLPSEIPDPQEATVIIDLVDGEKECPACKGKIDTFDTNRRQCYRCKCFFTSAGEDVTDTIAARKKMNFAVDDFDPTRNEMWHWLRTKNGKSVSTRVEQISEGPKKPPGKA